MRLDNSLVFFFFVVLLILLKARLSQVIVSVYGHPELARRSTTGLISKSLQLQVQLKLASLGRCHKSVDCAKSCALKYVCYCSQSGGSASIGLLAELLQSRDG